MKFMTISKHLYVNIVINPYRLRSAALSETMKPLTKFVEDMVRGHACIHACLYACMYAHTPATIPPVGRTRRHDCFAFVRVSDGLGGTRFQ